MQHRQGKQQICLTLSQALSAAKEALPAHFLSWNTRDSLNKIAVNNVEIEKKSRATTSRCSREHTYTKTTSKESVHISQDWTFCVSVIGAPVHILIPNAVKGDDEVLPSSFMYRLKVRLLEKLYNDRISYFLNSSI